MKLVKLWKYFLDKILKEVGEGIEKWSNKIKILITTPTEMEKSV